MARTKKRGRPREWALDEEIIEIHKLTTELKKQNPGASLSEIKGILKTELERTKKVDLLSRLDKILGLMKQVIPLPPRCICGNKVYSYANRKVEEENVHSWEIFARCINPNCFYMRRYLPSASYKWSRPKPASKELPPTFYQMDGQLVEKPK